MHPICCTFYDANQGKPIIMTQKEDLLSLVRDREKIYNLNGSDFPTPTLDKGIARLCSELSINEAELVEYEKLHNE